MKKTAFILLLCAWLLTACDVLIPQAVESIQKSLETAPPTVMVTREIVVKTIEQVVVTTTPIPTATHTPVPAFLGAPIQPDPALRRAVAVSLAALGTNFEIRLFTRAPGGEEVVWVQDANYPQTLLCGAPLYFPGLGSLLVLTTGHFYATLNQHNTFPSPAGCAALSLSKGKAQAQKILETYQGIYSALRSNKHFTTAEGVYAYVQDFLFKQKNAYPYELNLVLVPLVGEDWKQSSIELTCPGNKTGCINFYSFTGGDTTYDNSTTRHVPLAYARYWSNPTAELALLSARVQKAQSSAPAGSLFKTQPLTSPEVLSLWFQQEYWEQMVYRGAFTAGLGTIFQNMDVTVRYTNPAFTPLLPHTGSNHTMDGTLALYWAALSPYLDGKTEQAPSATFDAYITYARASIKTTYCDFLIFEQK